MNDIACRHCITMPKPHQKVCRCGHNHNDHIFAGGCKKCKTCQCYDQRDEIVPVKRAKTKESEPAPLSETETKVIADREADHATLVAAMDRVDNLKEKIKQRQRDRGVS